MVVAQGVQEADMPKERVVVVLKAPVAERREVRDQARKVACPLVEEDRGRGKSREWAGRGLISAAEVWDTRAVSSGD